MRDDPLYAATNGHGVQFWPWHDAVVWFCAIIAITM